VKVELCLLVCAAAATACADAAQCCLVPATVPVIEAPPPVVTYSAPEPPLVAAPSRASSVIVLQSTHIDRLSEVVGVIDVHTEMGGQSAALAELKWRAAQMGADAVVGVEFNHGHEDNGPTHLSGLGVRFIDRVE
jgi:hypothetical protein